MRRRPGRAMPWLLGLILLLAAATMALCLTSFRFRALFHVKTQTGATTAPATQPAPPPPPKPIALGKLDAIARFVPPEPRLLAFVDVEQLVSHKLVSYFQHQFAPYLAEFHLAPRDIRQIYVCGEDQGGFVAVRLRRQMALNEIFDKPAEPIQTINSTPQTSSRTSFGLLLAAMPEPDLLVLAPIKSPVPLSISPMAKLLSRTNRSGELDAQLVDAIRILDSQQAFVVFSRPAAGRDAPAAPEPILEAAGMMLTNVLQAKSILVYRDPKTAAAALQELHALKADLKNHRDPMASLADEVISSQDGQTIRLAGQWGITSIVRLLLSNRDPRALAPSAMRIAARLRLMP